jgi:hypothetical protein
MEIYILETSSQIMMTHGQNFQNDYNPQAYGIQF